MHLHTMCAVRLEEHARQGAKVYKLPEFVHSAWLLHVHTRPFELSGLHLGAR